MCRRRKAKASIGSLLDDEIYDNKGNRRIIPVLFDSEPESSIPRFLRGWTHCRTIEFVLDDRGYEHLIRILTGQGKVEKNQLGAGPVLSVGIGAGGFGRGREADQLLRLPPPRRRTRRRQEGDSRIRTAVSSMEQLECEPRKTGGRRPYFDYPLWP